MTDCNTSFAHHHNCMRQYYARNPLVESKVVQTSQVYAYLFACLSSPRDMFWDRHVHAIRCPADTLSLISTMPHLINGRRGRLVSFSIVSRTCAVNKRHGLISL